MSVNNNYLGGDSGEDSDEYDICGSKSSSLWGDAPILTSDLKMLESQKELASVSATLAAATKKRLQPKTKTANKKGVAAIDKSARSSIKDSQAVEEDALIGITNSINIDPVDTEDGNVSITRRTRSRRSKETAGNAETTVPFVVGTGRQVQRGRARRSYIAEIAARANVVDSIDLISSPSIPITGVVNVDSDDDGNDEHCSDPRNVCLDDSYDLDNPEISIKVKWHGKFELIKLRKFQKFADLIKILADNNNSDIKDVTLNLNDRIIHPNDTPHSIGYKIYEFIGGRILKSNSFVPAIRKHNVDEVELKIQSDRWKKPLIIHIQKFEKFKILYLKCCEELKISCEEIKLSFDGDLLEMNSTPDDLDFEGGEVIDCRIK